MNMPALSLTRDNVSPSRAQHESRSGAAQKRFRDGRVTVGHRGSAMWAIEQTQLSADTQGQWQASTAEFADIDLDAFVLDAANVAGDTDFFFGRCAPACPARGPPEAARRPWLPPAQCRRAACAEPSLAWRPGTRFFCGPACRARPDIR